MDDQFPRSITAGLTLSALLEWTGYPSGDWTATAYLRGPMSIDIPASAEDGAHDFSVEAGVTALWAPGRYAASIRVTDGTDVFQVDAFDVEILADVAAVAAGHDPSSHARRVLEAIEAVIEGRASRDQESYTINGRSLTRTSISDLMLLRDRYRREVASEKGRRRTMGRQVKVRFS